MALMGIRHCKRGAMDIQVRRDYIQEVKGLLSGCYARGGGGEEEKEKRRRKRKKNWWHC
jgi:hypothetical protein